MPPERRDTRDGDVSLSNVDNRVRLDFGRGVPMKRPILLLLSVAALVLGGAEPVFAWAGAFFDLFQVPFSAREAALGGNHAAQADDVSTLISNAAGFRSAGPELSIGTVSVSSYAKSSSNATWDLFGPLSIAYVGNGLGFGLFTDSNVNLVASSFYPTVVTENLVAISGYAFRIPVPDAWQSTLDVGFSVPLFLAARSLNTGDIYALLSSSVSPTQFFFDQGFILATGIGAEMGILYNWNNTFSVGIAGRDLAITSQKTYSTLLAFEQGAAPVQTATVPIPMDISVGIRWNLPLKISTTYIDGLTILADYNDIFDFIVYPAGATNPLLHFGFGIEFTLLNAVKLRAGFYQLLPCGGLSLDLSFFTLDFAVFGRELSTQPWTTPVYGYMASIRFHT